MSNPMKTQKLSREAEIAMEIADSADDHLGTEHVLFGLLYIASIRNAVRKLELDPERFHGVVYDYIQNGADASNPGEGKTDNFHQAMRLADEEREQQGKNEVDAIDIFIGILRSNCGSASMLILQALAEKELTHEECMQRKNDLLNKVRKIFTAH